MMNVFGNGEHFVGYPVTNSLLSWAYVSLVILWLSCTQATLHRTTRREPEAKETWRAMSEEAQQKFKEGPFSAWGCSVGEIVKSSPRIIKVGTIVRNARCVLLTFQLVRLV